MKKIFYLNFIVIVIICLCIEFCSAYSYIKKYNDTGNNLNYELKYEYKSPKFDEYIANFFSSFDERYYRSTNKTSKTVLILGCSYAMGAGLDTKQNFSSILSSLLDYNVLNMGFGGHGISSALNFFQNPSNVEKLNSKINSVDYVIYVYHVDHLRRLFLTNNILTGEFFTKYENIDEKLIKVRLNKMQQLFYSSFFYNNFFANKIAKSNFLKEKESYSLFNLIIKKLKITLDEIYSNPQFIILVVPTKYPAVINGVDSSFSEEEKKNIQKMGIQVVDASTLVDIDLKNEKYYIDDKCHPSTAYWENVSLSFSKFLK